MNVIELLKTDHETVSGLFRSFESAKKSESEAEKRQIVQKICQELEAHAAVEEELFYPAVEARAREDEKAESTVLEAQEEHALVKALVAELRSKSSRGNGRLDAKVKVLKDLVDHHVEEEEGQMMPRAKKLLSSEELEELGERVESRKQELKAGSSKRTPSKSASSARRSRRTSAPSRRRSSASASSRRSSASSSSRRSRASGSPRGGRRRSNGRRRRSR